MEFNKISIVSSLEQYRRTISRIVKQNFKNQKIETLENIYTFMCHSNANNEQILITSNCSNGIEKCEMLTSILSSLPKIKILITIDEGFNNYIDKIPYFEISAISKNDIDLLPKAIDSINQHKVYIQPKIKTFAWESIHSKNSSILHILSNREKEIMKFVYERFSVNEIANKLNISRRTVETHKYNMMKKLKVRSSNDVIDFCIKNKLF
ncbi:MAG: DNA-binding response regulator [Flavobacteriales bacterium]|nr:MAG: DNA-binding response regulator [Flavobacteriales bacterium]